MTTITIGNFKGGVGKTTACVLFSYLLSEQGKKVLLIDFDPQGNSTEIIQTTYNNIEKPKVSFYQGIKRMDLKDSFIAISKNLTLLPSDWNLSKLPELLEDYKKNERYYLLDHLLKSFKNDFDYIFIDVPPTLSVFTNNAILTSDYVLMVLQTQQQAFSSSVKFISYLKELKEDYHANFELLGIIQHLIKKDGRVDNEIMDLSRETFGDAIFTKQVFQRERVKRFGLSGITNEDTHDERVLFMYRQLLDEIEKRLLEF